FGFKILSKTQALIPDATEANGAIAVYNQGLSIHDPRRIKISFQHIDNEFGDLGSNVKSFLDTGTAPASQKNRQFYHDISAHALEGFFLNNKIIHTIQKRGKIWFD